MSDSSDESTRDRYSQLSGKRSGWAGEEMEMQHSRETWKKPSAESVAVDLEQFRNHQVGKGYQAKFVVRQKTGHEEEAASSKRKSSDEPPSSASKRTQRNDESRSKKKAKSHSDPLLKYLQCEGLRKFRKEIAKIEDS